MKTAGALLIAAVIGALFLWSCLMTAADGQGAIVFLLTGPVMLLLFGVGLFLVWRIPPAASATRRVLFGALGGELLIIALFFAGVVIPPLRGFPDLVIGGVSRGFERVTGVSPYVWVRQDRALAERLNRTLAESGAQVTHEQISRGKPWHRLCFFGPYTDDAAAADVLGFLASTLKRSRVRDSDAFVALVFLDEEGVVLDVIDVRRDALDLVALSRSCLTPADFPLAVEEEGGRRSVKASSRDRGATHEEPLDRP
jgi:hypothetical protein